MVNENTKTEILRFLEQQTDIINLKELSQKTNISYPTILKYCDILLAEGIVEIKDYGNNRFIKIKGVQDEKV